MQFFRRTVSFPGSWFILFTWCHKVFSFTRRKFLVTWWSLRWIFINWHIVEGSLSMSLFCLWEAFYLKDRRISFCCWWFWGEISWWGFYQNGGLVPGRRSQCKRIWRGEIGELFKVFSWHCKWWFDVKLIRWGGCWRWIFHRWLGAKSGLKRFKAIHRSLRYGCLCSNKVGYWGRKRGVNGCYWSFRNLRLQIRAFLLILCIFILSFVPE